MKRRNRLQTRRARSEEHLAQIIPTLNEGESCHIISQGDVDSLSFLKHMANGREIEYLLFSTWCMSEEDVILIGEMISERRIMRFDAYVGEIFPNQYTAAFARLTSLAKSCGGRVAVFRNHAKIFCAKSGEFEFVIESSANINTNPRCEQTAIHVSEELFRFYKDFFDGIKSFTRDFDDWKKYES